MEDQKSIVANEFIKNETLKLENRWFWWRVLTSSLGYWVVTWYLNDIRATASVGFLWTLTALQFICYVTIFTASYARARVFGLNKNIALVIFIGLAILGRVENWEIVLIPLLVTVMLIFSGTNRKVAI